MAYVVRWDPGGGEVYLPSPFLIQEGSLGSRYVGTGYQARGGTNRTASAGSLLARTAPGFPCKLSLQPGSSVSIPDGFLMPRDPSCLHVLGSFVRHFYSLRSPTQQPWEVAISIFTEPETSRGSRVKWLSDGTRHSCSDVHS